MSRGCNLGNQSPPVRSPGSRYIAGPMTEKSGAEFANYSSLQAPHLSEEKKDRRCLPVICELLDDVLPLKKIARKCEYELSENVIKKVSANRGGEASILAPLPFHKTVVFFHGRRRWCPSRPVRSTQAPSGSAPSHAEARFREPPPLGNSAANAAITHSRTRKLPWFILVNVLQTIMKKRGNGDGRHSTKLW